MKWDNGAIIDDINTQRFAHKAYESAFRAWMYMCAAESQYIILPQIKATAYGCPSIDSKLAWHIWLEHYVQELKRDGHSCLSFSLRSLNHLGGFGVML